MLAWIKSLLRHTQTETRILCVHNAFVCLSCQAILADCRGGSCILCGSESVESLGWLLAPAKERQQWIERIRGRNTDRRAKIIPLKESQVPHG